MAEAKKTETNKEAYLRLKSELAELDRDDPKFKETYKAYRKASMAYYSEPVKIRIPRPRPGEDKYQFIGWGQRSFRIKKGEEVEIPRGAAEVYERAERQREEAYDLMHGLSDEYERESKKY